jgi:hypothetical protein
VGPGVGGGGCGAGEVAEAEDGKYGEGAKDEQGGWGEDEGEEEAAEVEVVVDFAVEDEDIAGGLVAHWLVAGFGEIEDGEAGVAEPNRAVRRSPFRLAVRAAVTEGGEESGGVRGSGFRSEDAEDAAHGEGARLNSEFFQRC